MKTFLPAEVSEGNYKQLKKDKNKKRFIECSHRHSNRMQGTEVFQNWEISTFSLEAACTRPLLQRGPSHMAQGSPVKKGNDCKLYLETR